MALYVLFKNKNTLLFIYIFCFLFNLQMCQIILTDPVSTNTVFALKIAIDFKGSIAGNYGNGTASAKHKCSKASYNKKIFN